MNSKTSQEVQEKVNKIRLPDYVGKGYGTFWRSKHRYRVVKGSRASKKSKTMALWVIVNMIKYPEANTLVVRKTYRTLKDSCYTELKWAVHRLHLDKYWKFKESPLEAVYLPTGQKIFFRGLDGPLKITSITTDVGCLCWMWVEEAYEITKQEDFDILDESIRGEVPYGLFKQATIMFNPWNERHWLKKKFFDQEDPDVLAMTTNYMCNEWLDEADLKLFETMRINNPRRYRVAGLGDWGVVGGLVYENWEEYYFNLNEVENCKIVCGLDFGYTNDPSALFVGFLDLENKKLYVWDEMYKKGLSNRELKDEIVRMGYGKEFITCDSAEPKSIDELKFLGLKALSAKKGSDSVMNGIQWIQDLHIYVHPRCSNFLTEIGNYGWQEDKFGEKLNKPEDAFNHLMDAMRYGLEKYIVGNGWQLSTRKMI